MPRNSTITTQPGPKARKKLGELLREAELIDEMTLTKALELQKTQKKRLGQILIDMGAIDDIQIVRALSIQLDIPFIRLQDISLPPNVIQTISPEMAEHYLVIPLKTSDKELLVTMGNPLEFYALEDLRFFTGKSIKIAVSPQHDVLEALERYYPKPGLREKLDSPQEEPSIQVIPKVEKAEKDLEHLLKIAELPPVVKLANSILADAIKLEASDIHIEPQKTEVLIRYRVDGIMREIAKTEKHVQTSLVSRVKIMSNMDISIRRKPQDGRATVLFRGKHYDLRVSSLPTSYGEKLTIRILDPKSSQRSLDDLGLSTASARLLKQCLHRPQGIIIVTGPTGSGKSSTLYTCLNELHTPDVNIVTVEDPVEYDIKGINQVQIDPKSGMTFASGLRSILRQDPDIVMVGEIRDRETALIACQAAQTGHLVLSTLHTNDAPSGVTRLLDLGVEAFLLADSLIAVLGQRLVRKICPHCKAPEVVSPELLKQLPLKAAQSSALQFFRGTGCEACRYTGYAGRLGIYEIFQLAPAFRKLIVADTSSSALKQAAEREGFESLGMDGINKAAQGLTTIEEVFRVAPFDVHERHQQPAIVSKKIVATQERSGIPREERTASPEYSSPVSAVHPRKILLVDDSPFVLELLKHVLESENYCVTTAQNGLDAFKLALQEIPDLVITDLSMPEMNGIELVNKLKHELSTRFIPVILLTGEGDLDSEAASFDAGADEYLMKPIEPKRLILRVNRLLKSTESLHDHAER